jgi:ribosomal protein L44E
MRSDSADNLIGQEIETYCGKCKTETLHTVTAMKDGKIHKVMCKTCMGYHLYRAAAKATASTSTTRRRASTTPRNSGRGKKDWGTLVGQIDDQQVAEYDIAGEFSTIPAIRHKNFGVGVITKVLTKNKIEVLFQDGTKILAQNLEAGA